MAREEREEAVRQKQGGKEDEIKAGDRDRGRIYPVLIRTKCQWHLSFRGREGHQMNPLEHTLNNKEGA